VQSAGLLCTWREVYAGFSDFQLKQGDDIVVFGAGPVGLSFMKFAKLRGLGTVWSIDPVAQKRKKAIEMGADDAPYNFNLLVHQWPTRKWEAEAQEPLCEWISRGKLDYREFVSAEFRIQDIKEALEYAMAGESIKTMLRW
jgi:threonine dehydrogenase-like Zn-dependent dehydrogenase